MTKHPASLVGPEDNNKHSNRRNRKEPEEKGKRRLAKVKRVPGNATNLWKLNKHAIVPWSLRRKAALPTNTAQTLDLQHAESLIPQALANLVQWLSK